MEAIDYASDVDPRDFSDPNDFRHCPAVLRAVWGWWNGLLLVAALVLWCVICFSSRPWFEPAAAEFLWMAPLAAVLSLLVAQAKIDLSYPALTALVAAIGAHRAPQAAGAELSFALLMMVFMSLGMGIVNWSLSRLPGVPSAIATLLMAVVLSLPLPVFRFNGVSGPWSSPDELTFVFRWVLGATLSVTCLLAWMLVRRRARWGAEGERLPIVQLFSFIGVSAIATLYGICMPHTPSARMDNLPMQGLEMVAPVLACVLVGGTLWGARLANPLGAVLATAVLVALQAVNAEIGGRYGEPRFLLYITIFPALVVIGYTPRVRELFTRVHERRLPLPAPRLAYHVVAIGLLVLAGLAGAGLWMRRPLMLIGTSVWPFDASTRLTSLAEFSVVVSVILYLTLFSLDLFVCARSRRARTP